MATTNTTEAGRETARMNAKQRKAAEKARKAAVVAVIETPAGTVIEHGETPVKAPKLTKTGLPRLPAIKRQRKPKPARPCSCGCGGETKGGRFIPGHDSRLKGWLLRIERKIVTLDQIPEGERAAVVAHLAAVSK